jgi:hypothetical protein
MRVLINQQSKNNLIFSLDSSEDREKRIEEKRKKKREEERMRGEEERMRGEEKRRG